MNPAPVAVVRASALRGNLETVRRAAPGCRILAVVKANAYGHGLVAVAQVLAGADGFAVARLDEAVQLREAGIVGKVVVLGGFLSAEEIRLAMRYRLDVVVHSREQIGTLESLRDATALDIWIKIDTGMGRLGLEPEELGPSVARLLASPVRGGTLRLMTHLAGADAAADPATRIQLEKFATLLPGWRGDVSAANSAAILQWPGARITPGAGHAALSWVRPGLMLYGASPLAGQSAVDLGLLPAMSFETRLMAVKKIPKGRRVGYGGDWQARRDSVVGVAAAGYADGYPWHVANGTSVLVHGQRAPVIGRVSMDMISIDLTDLPLVKPGDRVVLWGDGLPVDEVAGHAGTIAYELLAGMSPRVTRQVEG